ncbi:MAG: efflux RND transporter periplasmic adaptor subunit [Rhodothermales bacterium]|nr:efflux RND transporter periplasmic adaptor subunit [Rhodothermales bacterium]
MKIDQLVPLSGAGRSNVLTLALLPALLLATLAFVGCNRNADAEQPGPPSDALAVRTAPVVRDTRPMPIYTSGRLAAKSEMKLSFKIGGLVDGLFVDEGARVRAGAVLAQLNRTEIDAQVLQAERADEKAQRDLERVEALFADSVATLEQVQDARTGAEIAGASLRIAAFNRQHATIVAPVSGRVLRRLAEPNELVQAGQPLFLFAGDTSGWIVRMGLADRDIVKLSLADSVHLAFDAYPDVLFTGYVSEIADAADPLSGTFEVEVAIADPAGKLKSGFIARASLYPSQAETYDFVPVEALVEGDGQEGIVYGLGSDRKVQKHVIRIGRMLDNEVAVAAGLEGVDEVITEGAGFLNDGDSVRVVD